MGAIGSYQYPDIGISDAIEVCRVVEDTFNGHVEDYENLANALDHKNAKSGGFRAKLAALRRYGLSSGRGSVELTELAKTLAHPMDEDEKREACYKAFLNVPLFKTIIDNIGSEITQQDFWIQLAELTDADRSEARDEAPKVKRVYEDCLRAVGRHYLDKLSEPRSPGVSEQRKVEKTRREGEQSPDPGFDPSEEVDRIVFDDILILCPPTQEDITTAIDLLKMKKKRIEQKGGSSTVDDQEAGESKGSDEEEDESGFRDMV